MKRIIALLCILSLCLLCGCVPQTPEGTDAELWTKLNGTWDNAAGDSVSFYILEGRYCFKQEGTVSFTGALTSVLIGSDGSYRLVFANESEADAKSVVFYADAKDAAEGVLMLREKSGEYVEYILRDEPDEPDVDYKTLWAQLAGYWTNTDNEYVKFDTVSDKLMFNNGRWQSELARQDGEVKRVNLLETGIYEIEVLFSAQPANQLSAALPELALQFRMDLTGLADKHISIKYDSTAYREYTFSKYLAPTQGLTIEELWTKLTPIYTSADNDYIKFSTEGTDFFVSLGKWQTEYLLVGRVVSFVSQTPTIYSIKLEISGGQTGVLEGEATEYDLVLDIYDGSYTMVFVDSIDYEYMVFYSDPDGAGMP